MRLAPVPTGSEKELVSGPVVPSTESMARGSRASAVNQSAADYHPYLSAPGFRNSVVDVAWASSPCRSGTTPKSLGGHVAPTARAISERASERAWNGLPRVPRQRQGLDVHAGTRARSARSVFPKTLCGELFHLEGIFKKSSTTPTGKIAQSREPLTMPPSRGSHPAPNRCPDSQLNPQFPRSGDGGFRAEMDDAMAFWVYWPESADQGKRESSP